MTSGDRSGGVFAKKGEIAGQARNDEQKVRNDVQKVRNDAQRKVHWHADDVLQTGERVVRRLRVKPAMTHKRFAMAYRGACGERAKEVLNGQNRT